MLTKADVWKLQDAKARFSELVRRARAGVPQEVTVHGKPAVVVIDLERYEIRRKTTKPKTLAGFVEASKKYRGLAEGIDFEAHGSMPFRRRKPFDERDENER